MKKKKDQPAKILLKEVMKDEALTSALQVCDIEAKVIDNAVQLIDSLSMKPPVPGDSKSKSSFQEAIGVNEDDLLSPGLAASLKHNEGLHRFMTSFRETSQHNNVVLFPEYGDEDLIPIGLQNFDEFYASATEMIKAQAAVTKAGSFRGVTAEHLSLEDAGAGERAV